jgi:hypothetical protein
MDGLLGNNFLSRHLHVGQGIMIPYTPLLSFLSFPLSFFLITKISFHGRLLGSLFCTVHRYFAFEKKE